MNWRSLISCVLISLVYYLLKPIKDSLLITSNASGAAVIPFVKLWCLFPSTIALGISYSYFARKYCLQKVSRAFIGLFLVGLCGVAFFLFPLQNKVQADVLADWLQFHLPTGWTGLAEMVRFWPYVIFYLLAELWGSFVFIVLIWSLINNSTCFDQAKKAFPFYLLAGNATAILAGPLGTWMTANSWENTLSNTMGLVLLLGFGSLFFLPKAFDQKKEWESSFLSDFKQALSSKYIVHLMLIGFCFNVMINFGEVVWKQSVLMICPLPGDYARYMGNVVSWTGIIATLGTCFLALPWMRKMEWRSGALVTPIITMTSGVLFFGAFLSPMIPMALTAALGSLHICLERSCRYTFYDITREMAYIPLSYKERILGKSLICGFGSKSGRVAGSIMMQLLLLINTSITASISGIVCIFILTGIFYIRSIFKINYINKKVIKLTQS